MLRFGSWLARAFGSLGVVTILGLAAPGESFAQAQQAQPAQPEFSYRRTEVETARAIPEACIVFTAPLLQGDANRYRDFVRMPEGRQPALRVDGSRLCLSGLAFGRQYEIQLRAGLPAGDGRRLPENETVNVELRDRDPLIAFGDGFILARESADGVPVNTVNVAKVRVTIYRVPDRGLAQFGRGRPARGEISSWEARNIASQSAAQVWQGEMDVANNLRNETVTTLFPLQRALRERRPGLYLLVAVDAAQVRDARRGSDEDDLWYTLFESGRMAAQWVVETDIGLATYRGVEGLTVFARSLNTARPIEGVEVALLARSNDELARVRTDRDGRAHFAAGLLRGSGGASPQLVQAFGAAGDFSYQDLNRPAFDLSDRGVDGRSAAGPVDAFLYTERGIYRPRETVHVTALLRDRIANAIAGAPVTLWVNRPDGVEFRRVTLNQAQASAGMFHWPLTLSDTAPRGRWEAVASIDGTTPVGRVAFQVQDFVPQKLRVQASTTQRALQPDSNVNVAVQVDFLYGAPGADLPIEGEARITVDQNPYPQHEGYRFGLVTDRFEDQTVSLAGANTNAQGRGEVTGRLEGVQANSLPLRAEITVSAIEPGGRPVREQLSLPVRTLATLLGIRPSFRDGRMDEDAEGRFDVIAIDAEGNRVARRNVTWTLVREVTNYTWFQTDGRWRFQATTRDRPVADGALNVGASDPARVARALGWGTYRLTVRDQEANAASSIRFFAGWGAPTEDERPDRAEVAADKPAYRPGETARLRVRAPSAGQALVVIANDRVLAHRLVDVPQDGATVEIPVGEDWGAGAYAIVSTFRPAGDRARRAPVRAIGVAWMGIDASGRTLNLAIEAPAQVLPRQRLDVTVRVANATPGARPTLTLAAVDEGILLLTRYQSPRPQDWYFGKRRLGVDIRDDYGRLIDATSGMAGAIREGGDALGGRGLDVVPIRIVSLFSGVVQVGEDGTARIPIDVPDFNGQLRLMAVASDPGRIGSAEARTIVRDPVVAEAVFPRFLAPGDRSTITTVLHNVDGQAGAYRMRVSAEGAVRITGGAVDREIRLNTNERQQALIGFEGAEVGIGTVTLAVSGPGNFAVERQWQIQVRPGAAPISEESVAVLRPGDTLRLEQSMLENFVPGTGQVAVTLSAVRGYDVPALLRALDRYPFGCLEQTTSRAFPLLVYDDLRLLGRAAQDRSIRTRVQGAIDRVLDMQADDGGFGMWYAGGDADGWLSVFSIDFLTQAKQRGYDIPDRALRRATLFLQQMVDETGENSAEGQAYAAWVLARSGAARPGDIRALYDSRAGRLNDALSLAQLGGALLQIGDQARAREAFARAVDKIGQRPRKGTVGWYYGSTLRDLSGFIAVAAQAGETQLLTQLVARLETFDTSTRYSTTQEQSWMLLAAYAMSNSSGRINVSVDGAAASERRDPVHLAIGEAELARGSTVRNEGARDVFRSVAVQGIPRTPAPAIARGMSVRRDFRTLGGELVDLERVRQNDRIVVVIDGRFDGLEAGEIAVLDLLPAGFEIEATLSPGEGGRGPYPWIGRLRTTRVQEARDDRFVAAIRFNERLANRVYNEEAADLADELRRRFRIAYVVRAITPGSYVVPGTSAEDMYRAQIRARTAAGRVTIQPR